jgi:hypothetical protein
LTDEIRALEWMNGEVGNENDKTEEERKDGLGQAEEPDYRDDEPKRRSKGSAILKISHT